MRLVTGGQITPVKFLVFSSPEPRGSFVAQCALALQG